MVITINAAKRKNNSEEIYGISIKNDKKYVHAYIILSKIINTP